MVPWCLPFILIKSLCLSGFLIAFFIFRIYHFKTSFPILGSQEGRHPGMVRASFGTLATTLLGDVEGENDKNVVINYNPALDLGWLSPKSVERRRRLCGALKKKTSTQRRNKLFSSGEFFLSSEAADFAVPSAGNGDQLTIQVDTSRVFFCVAPFEHDMIFVLFSDYVSCQAFHQVDMQMILSPSAMFWPVPWASNNSGNIGVSLGGGGDGTPINWRRNQSYRIELIHSSCFIYTHLAFFRGCGRLS